MPVATHGGFDLAVEIDQSFATTLAQLTLPLQTVSVPLAPEPQDPNTNPRTGTATVVPRLRYVWFNVEPSYVGAMQPQRTRTETDLVSIVLELNGAIELRTVLIDDPFSNQAPPPKVVFNVPDGVKSIPLRAIVEVTNRLSTLQGEAVLDRAKPTEKTPAASTVVDFTAAPGPVVDVRFRQQDQNALFGAPLLTLLLGQVRLKADEAKRRQGARRRRSPPRAKRQSWPRRRICSPRSGRPSRPLSRRHLRRSSTGGLTGRASWPSTCARSAVGRRVPWP